MGKFYFAFAWDIIVNLHVCICKNKICIWSDPGVNLPICKYTPVCICVRMRHLLTPSKICTPEYIYTCVFLAHANWTKVLHCAPDLLQFDLPMEKAGFLTMRCSFSFFFNLNKLVNHYILSKYDLLLSCLFISVS